MNYLKNTKNNKIYRIENDEPIEDTDIEHYIEVSFNDDSYVNGDDKKRICLVRISIVLKFEQINFTNNKIYSVFEIGSRIYSPSDKKRDYEQISNELLKKI